ncbi:hypothetical protein LguiA_036566 [Lonicera macranthoides]
MEDSFNLAVGFGLVYLTTTNKNELNKMTELWMQMEMLLQNVKEALQSQKTEAHSETSELNANLACATSDTQVGMDNLSFVDNLADSENVSVFAQSFNCITTGQEKCAEEMDQLEAKLQEELELGNKISVFYQKKESTSNHLEERSLEMAIEGTAPGGSLSASFGEVIDHPDSRSKGQGGVSPNELEIRLHELLEARQEQRITELQANLEQAKRKLLEKETEVSQCKDTAQAVYLRLSKTPPLSR